MRKTPVYHVGLVRGTGPTRYWRNGHAKGTVVVELRRSVDFLSTETWQYLGERVTTKADYARRKADILQWINTRFATTFTHIIID